MHVLPDDTNGAVLRLAPLDADRCGRADVPHAGRVAHLGATDQHVVLLAETEEGMALSQLQPAAERARHAAPVSTPVPLPPALARSAATHVVSLVCGKAHVALLDAGGTVWTYGAGGQGQLGHGDMETLASPR